MENKMMQIEITFIVQKIADGEYSEIMCGFLCDMEKLNSFDFTEAIEKTRADLQWCNDVRLSEIVIR